MSRMQQHAKRVRREKRLSLRESLRMFDRNFDTVFCAKRPWLRRNGSDPVFGNGNVVPAPANNTPQALAKHFLALPDPPRGTLAAMVRRAGLSFGAVYQAVAYERMKRRRQEAKR